MGDVLKYVSPTGQAEQLGSMLGIGVGAPNTSGFAPSAAENQFTGQLMDQYNGNGPSVAGLQMQKGLDQSNANAAGLAASQRGVSPALAARMAAQAQSANQQGTNQNAGIVRAQEQMQAGQTLGGMFASQRQSAGQANALVNQATQAGYDRFGNLVSSAGSAGAKMMAAHGGVAPEPQHPQIHPDVAAFAAKLGEIAANKALAGGGNVPGIANVPGDDTRNDTVPAMLSPGEMVIPRTVVAQGPDAVARFASALSKRGGKSA